MWAPNRTIRRLFNNVSATQIDIQQPAREITVSSNGFTQGLSLLACQNLFRRLICRVKTRSTVWQYCSVSLGEGAGGLRAKVFAVIAVVISSLLLLAPVAQAEVKLQSGFVMTRASVLGPNGLPIYAEIGSDGQVVSDIKVSETDYQGAQVMAASTYRGIYQTFINHKAEHQNETAYQGAYLVTRAVYDATDFGSIDVTVIGDASSGAQRATETVVIPKRALPSSVKSVLLRHKDSIIDPRLLPKEGVVLYQAPINLLNGIVKDSLDSSISALLLDAKGSVLHESKHNIGFKTALFETGDGSFRDTRYRQAGDTPLGPVAHARVDTSFGMAPAYTAEDGNYRLYY